MQTSSGLAGHAGFFVRGRLAALLAELFELKLALHLFLVLGGVVIGALANRAF